MVSAQYSHHSLELVGLVTQRTMGQINRHLTLREAPKRAVCRYHHLGVAWGTAESEATPGYWGKGSGGHFDEGSQGTILRLIPFVKTCWPITHLCKGHSSVRWTASCNLFLGLSFCKIKSKTKQTEEPILSPHMPNSPNTPTSQKHKQIRQRGDGILLQPPVLGSVWIYVCLEILLHLLKSHIGDA